MSKSFSPKREQDGLGKSPLTLGKLCIYRHDVHRYVEWEKYPEKKAAAKGILATKKFTPIPGELDTFAVIVS